MLRVCLVWVGWIEMVGRGNAVRFELCRRLTTSLFSGNEKRNFTANTFILLRDK